MRTLLSKRLILFGKILMFQAAIILSWSLDGYSLGHIEVSRFSERGLDNWIIQKFKDQTSYSIEQQGNSSVVRARGEGVASALIKNIDVDLSKTPFLNWSWKVENALQIENERIKNGDDFSARVYVIVKESIMIWRTKALNYVWSSNQPIGSSWTNPYTNNVKMISLRSGNEQAGTWVNEKRNVRADLKKMFGYDIQTINGIAIMTDTDNSQGSATAYYGDLYFTAE